MLSCSYMDEQKSIAAKLPELKNISAIQLKYNKKTDRQATHTHYLSASRSKALGNIVNTGLRHLNPLFSSYLQQENFIRMPSVKPTFSNKIQHHTNCY